MRVLITGGAGYVGTELAHQLAKQPLVDEVQIYDNFSRKNFNLFIAGQLSPKIRFINGDILDSRKLKQVLKDTDAVIHLAAKVTTPFASEDPHQFEQINHWGTAELCYAIEERNIKKFIYLSSTSVYGTSAEMADEQTPTDPKTFYGSSKLRGEKHVERLMDKMNSYIIRCGNVYGYSPSMRFDAVINRFMFEANFINRISIQGNGNQRRSFIHVKKVVNALEQMLVKNIPVDIYNLADKNVSVLELVSTIKEIYPALEFIFVNQHMNLRNLEINPDLKIKKHIDIAESDLLTELQQFSQKFSFHNNPIEIKVD